MTTGTKSLLFGVHQFIWHPITVYKAWQQLHEKRPDFWETICIIVHDWGYFGCANMDDVKGEQHPGVGAWLVWWLYCTTHRGPRRFDVDRASYLYRLARYHSRYLAAREGAQPSLLCWADKLSLSFDPRWFYLLRARMSGELAEYRYRARAIVPLTATDDEWFLWCEKKCALDAHLERTANPRNFSLSDPEQATPSGVTQL